MLIECFLISFDSIFSYYFIILQDSLCETLWLRYFSLRINLCELGRRLGKETVSERHRARKLIIMETGGTASISFLLGIQLLIKYQFMRLYMPFLQNNILCGVSAPWFRRRWIKTNWLIETVLLLIKMKIIVQPKKPKKTKQKEQQLILMRFCMRVSGIVCWKIT